MQILSLQIGGVSIQNDDSFNEESIEPARFPLATIRSCLASFLLGYLLGLDVPLPIV